MIPISVEEQIVCFADKFFSKNEEFLSKEKSPEMIRAEALKFGDDKVKIFDDWFKKFSS